MYVAFIWLNGICVAVVLMLTFVLATMLRNRLAGLAALLLALVLVAANPWTAVPYTDLPAMPLVLGGLTAAVGGLRVRNHIARIVLFATAGASLGVAYVIKTTPAAVALAFALVLVVATLRRPRALATVVLGGCLVAGGLGFLGGAAAANAQTDALSGIDRSALDAERTPPAAWWVAMGLTERYTVDNQLMYGVYNPEMVDASRNLRGEALARYSQAELHAQLDRLGPLGLARFEVDKQLYNWGDGMFFAWGEGPDADAARQLDHSHIARSVQEWQQAQGRHYVLRANVTTALWLLLVGAAGMGLLTVPYRRDWLASALAVLGLAMFVLVFQGRSRYVFPAAPMVVALAVSTSPVRRVAPLLLRGRARLRGATRPRER
jgi:4-amino-4-deoxy-L-arabinose transferase-like glycosyltransferase